MCFGLIHAVIGRLTGLAGVTGAIAVEGLSLTPVLLVAAITLLFHRDLADKMEWIQLFNQGAIMGGLPLKADQVSGGCRYWVPKLPSLRDTAPLRHVGRHP